MYVRRCYREKNGKRHDYWALVESYRTARGPRQRVVAYLGELNEGGRIGVQQAVQPASIAQEHLFGPLSGSPEWVEVDIHGVRVERSRQFGGCWRLFVNWVFLHRWRSCCRPGGKGFRGV